MSDVQDPSSGSEFEDGPGTDPSNQNGNESKNEGGRKRTIDNVYGELSRKQEKSNSELRSEIAALAESVKSLTEITKQTAGQGQRFAQGNQPNYQRPNQMFVPAHNASPGNLENFSEQELNFALGSGKLGPTEIRAVERELERRALDSRFDAEFERREKDSRIKQLRKESHEAALQSFPALRDKSSDFSRRVEQAIQEQKALGIDTPTAEFDVANRLARQMGVEPARIAIPGYQAPADHGKAPEPDSDEPEGHSEEHVKSVTSALETAMPLIIDPKTGKRVRKKFNLKRIQARSKTYEQNKRLYVGGRKVKGDD